MGESDHCTIENNTCVLNPTGISLTNKARATCRSVDGEQATYHVHDVSVRNICLNTRYQVGLWWDNAFFGPHPSASRGSLGTAYDPDQNNIRFDQNLYWAEGQQAFALWGCPWRPKHKNYADFTAWRTDRKQDVQSLAADPRFLRPTMATGVCGRRVRLNNSVQARLRCPSSSGIKVLKKRQARG